jgi:hypothetical protein
MRCGRFTVLFFASILTGLLAASLAPWPISAAVTSCLELSELSLSGAGASPPAIDGDAVIAVEALTKTSWKLCAPGASRFIATPPAVSRADCDPLGAHTGRAPPLA